MKSVRLMGRDGDRVLVWEADQDAAMVAFIQKKMDQGYMFFVVDKNVEPGTEVWKALASAKDAKKTRRVTMSDPDAEAEVAAGRAGVAKSGSNDVATTRKATTARDAADNNTVAVRSASGG